MATAVQTPGELTPRPPETERVSPFRAFWRALLRSKSGFIGFIGFAVIVLVSLVGPFFTPGGNPADPARIYEGPSVAHPLGLDFEGRDVLMLLIDGGRPVLLIGLLAALISTVIAVFFGALAAYVGGRVDAVIVTATDIVLTVPQIIVLAVIASFYEVGNSFGLALILGLLGWPALLRAVRAQALSLKEREYIEAARLLDLGTASIVLREIVPNMASFILMNYVIGATQAIYALAGLYVLGLAPMQGTNWGISIHWADNQSAIYNSEAIFSVMAPILAICLVQLSLVTMSRSFEEILNPRLRHN